MNELAMLLKAAACDSLRGKSAEIFQLRFSFLYEEGEIVSVEEIAARYDMRRDRVRQLLAKCMTRMRWKGHRHIRRGDPGAPCARLLLFLQRQVGSDLPPQAVHELARRYTTLHEWEIAHLVLTIAMPSGERRRYLLSSTKFFIAKQQRREIAPATALPQPARSVII